MRVGRIGLTGLAIAAASLFVAQASAQLATVATPFHQLNDSFFENMGTSWSLMGKGWYFNYGSLNNAAPQVGGFQPSAGLSFGFARMGGGVTGRFNANFSQGYRQSLVSQTPSVTVMNGATGYVSDTSQTPFVISYIPVVGSYPMFDGYPLIGALMPAPLPGYDYSLPQGAAMPSGHGAVQEALRRVKTGAAQGGQALPLEPQAEDPVVGAGQPAAPRARGAENDLLLGGAAATESRNRPASATVEIQASSAGLAVPSVAEARRLHAAEVAAQNGDAAKYVELARGAEESGKPKLAKLYYQMAARRACGELKTQILARLDELTRESKGGK